MTVRELPNTGMLKASRETCVKHYNREAHNLLLMTYLHFTKASWLDVSKVLFESKFTTSRAYRYAGEINASNACFYWWSLQHCLELHRLCSVIVLNDLSLTSSLWLILDSSIKCPTKARPQEGNCLAGIFILKHIRRVATVVLSEYGGAKRACSITRCWTHLSVVTLSVLLLMTE